MIDHINKTKSPAASDEAVQNLQQYGSGTDEPSNPFRKVKILTILLIVTVIIGQSVTAIMKRVGKNNGSQPGSQSSQPLEKFKSEAEFKKYLEDSAALSENSYAFSGIETRMDLGAGPTTGGKLGAPSGIGISNPAFETAEPYRVSDTNVQVKGIDEPDILKTDGKNIFYSPQNYYIYSGMTERSIPVDNNSDLLYPPEYKNPGIKILSAYPPENLKEISEIGENGNLLFYKYNLLVFYGNGQKVVGYNVSDPTKPQESWKMDLKENNNVVTSRLMGDYLYLITSTHVNSYSPCISPVFGGTRDLSIACTDIYRPNHSTLSDSTYTVFKVDPVTGEVKEKSSFLGSSQGSVVYMSPNAVYITYTKTEGYLNIFIDFFVNESDGLMPSEVIEKFKKIKSYDISFEAKMLEVQRISEEYSNSLSSDERAKLENEMQNKMEDYLKKRSREITQSAIAKININDFKVNTSSLVPGVPLNQFALDEYDGNLRIATTIGDGMFGSEISANDVYILNSNMDMVGSIKDLGLTERIYSVRFIADKGYVVTFRQTDPFYVLDLSDPKNPQKKGELKIPGYSSYLEPIDKNHVIGIGKEGQNVKLSLFNVENPSAPLEVSKYDLDEYYSEALNDHHAFLKDPENEIFFMPGNRGGYIFSYSGNTFSLKRVVSDIIAKRALYINNYLYVAGDDKIIILDLKNYEEVNRIVF